MPAEWERHGVVLLAWPHSQTDWAYMLEEVQECYHRIIDSITEAGEHVILLAPAHERPEIEHPQVTVVSVDTNDTWIRDYGPLTLEDEEDGIELLDFRFNGWGLKFASNFDNQVNKHLGLRHVYAHRPTCMKQMVLEGGSIESDGKGTLLTTACCLLAPNRNEPMTRAQIDAALKEQLHADRVLWLEHGALTGDDTDGHIDTLCRLAPDDTIVYTGCHDSGDEHFETLQAMARQLRTFTTKEAQPYNLVELPLPSAIYNPEDGSRLPATYANYLVLERAVLMPSYNQPMNDKLAADTLRIVYPDREIIQVDCRALIRQHGSLHCATMQVPTQAISFL